MLLIFLLSLAAAAPKEIKYKTYVVKVECNTCTCQKATDEKTQWESAPCTCTAMACARRGEVPYDPDFWNKK